jgi:Na+-transporting methylmalonyl-CoA/oxaloacetate decarboxylase gamma subunit
MNNILEIGTQATLMGIGIVFAVLLLLCFAVKIIMEITSPKKSIPPRSAAKTAKTAEAGAAEIKKPPAADGSVNNQYLFISEEGINPSVIAAITAAVCATAGRSASALKFKSIKRQKTMYDEWSAHSLSRMINNS